MLPSILFNYYLGKDLAFELEVGAKRTWREQAGVKDNDTELFFTVGYRYDFYADGKGRCPAGVDSLPMMHEVQDTQRTSRSAWPTAVDQRNEDRVAYEL